MEKSRKNLNQAVESISKFLSEEKGKIILLKGFDNEMKLLASFIAVNKNFDKCILLTNTMKNASHYVNDAFERKQVLPRSVNSNKIYKIDDLNLGIYSYSTTSSNSFYGNDETCTIVYPIQTALDNSEKYEKLLSNIKKIDSRKIILITSNEWSIKNWDIEEISDKVIFINSEDDNPDLNRNLRANGIINS